MGRISTYLRALKARTGYTQQQLSDISHVPIGTIPHYFSDLDDDSANFEIVRKLVVTMGGSLDELAGIAAPVSAEPEGQSLSEMYRAMICEQIAFERRRARICLVVSFLSLGFIVCLFAADYLMPTTGWLK